jgi:hypothetical protein
MSNGKSKELESIIYELAHLDDLVNIVFNMISIRSLIHNPNTPLEFINFKSLRETMQHMVCAKNKHINKHFVLNHVDDIKTYEIWDYLIQYRITIDSEIFDKLPNDLKSYVSITHHLRLDVPRKTLMEWCPSHRLDELAKCPMTTDEIEYLLSEYSGGYVYSMYRALAKYQCLTQRHLDIMKKRHLNYALKTIEDYY